MTWTATSSSIGKQSASKNGQCKRGETYFRFGRISRKVLAKHDHSTYDLHDIRKRGGQWHRNQAARRSKGILQRDDANNVADNDPVYVRIRHYSKQWCYGFSRAT